MNFFYYKLIHAAHEDGVWGLAWTCHHQTGEEFILTGGVDNAVKAWTWYGHYVMFCCQIIHD